MACPPLSYDFNCVLHLQCLTSPFQLVLTILPLYESPEAADRNINFERLPPIFHTNIPQRVFKKLARNPSFEALQSISTPLYITTRRQVNVFKTISRRYSKRNKVLLVCLKIRSRCESTLAHFKLKVSSAKYHL